MESKLCLVRVELYGTACNGYPLIEVHANSNLVFRGDIAGTTQVEFEVLLDKTNTIQVSLVNKQNGPTVYDTVVDENGNILQDKSCNIVNIYFDRAKANFLLDDLEYEFDSGNKAMIYGYLSQNGRYNIQFPDDVYDWIIENRRKKLPRRTNQSSLTYDSIYFNENDNTYIDELINECKKVLNKF
jgi:hypothetical protein